MTVNEINSATNRTSSIRVDSHLHQQQATEDHSWSEISEVVESDFLISPGDIYPSRKVELKDAEVSPENAAEIR